MKRFLLFSLLLFLCSAFIIEEQNTEWATTSGTVKFKIKNAGFTVDGYFEALIAKIIFDPTKGYGNSIEASIDAKTINTDNSTRDGHLKKEEYFNVDKFPKIMLKGNLFAKQSDGSYKGFFKLTMKNITKDIAIPFTFSEKDGKGIFKGVFTINRLDYGVGASSMILSDDVIISIEVNVIKK